MTDDLIARLRICEKYDPDQKEAADALEAQARRIAKLENEIVSRDALIDDHLRKIMQLENLIEAEAFKVKEAEASIDRNDKWAEGFIEKTDAHIEKLKAALKPFAAVCDVWEDGKTGDNAERYFTLRVGDLRAARAAYLGEKDD